MKMRRKVISARRLILALMLGIGALVFGASTASAHVVTVACAGTGTGQWTITNSQTTDTMTFSAAGASPSSGTIPGGGSATVGFSGTSLTVVATWGDLTKTATGSGDCTVPTTTTTVPETTTTTTLPCEFNPQLPPDDPGCHETTTTTSTTTTSTTTTSTTTTLPCVPPDDPGCVTTTTTTLPCEFDPLLPPDDPGCEEPTTTTAPSVLSIAAISPVCLRDAPYIEVTFGDQPQFNGFPATVTFIDINGVVVGTETATFQAGATVRFVYPGASVDAAGNPLDWPGWVFDGDEWVVDPTDAYLREGLTVVVEVNPTASDTVSYPPATPSCTADPPTTPRLPLTR
jgi:hypothetical protein